MAGKTSKTALFWSFAAGVVVALIISAATFIWISNAPIPFVNKVQTVNESVDPALLDGKTIDPNQPLYADGQGAEQSQSSVATVTASGNSEASSEVADTQRYWVQAGAFSQSEDAENMRARIAFIGLDAQIAYRSENGQRLYRVRIGPFETSNQAEEIRQSLADNGIQASVLQQNN